LRQWLPDTSEEFMQKSRFAEEQMIAILQEADKAPVPEVARKHKVSAQAIYA
jgi:putative transposase